MNSLTISWIPAPSVPGIKEFYSVTVIAVGYSLNITRTQPQYILTVGDTDVACDIYKLYIATANLEGESEASVIEVIPPSLPMIRPVSESLEHVIKKRPEENQGISIIITFQVWK